MGRVKKMAGRALSAIDWRSDCSNIGPSRKPSTSGASGMARRRMT